MMNESKPIQQLPPASPYSDMSLPATNFYITNTQLQSVPLQSHVDGARGGDGENLKSMAIINNRNTQFDTLQLPAHVEEAIKKERRYLQHLSVEQ